MGAFGLFTVYGFIRSYKYDNKEDIPAVKSNIASLKYKIYR
jgi:hypothetical protein